MAQIDDFFMYENRVEGITEAEDVGGGSRYFIPIYHFSPEIAL